MYLSVSSYSFEAIPLEGTLAIAKAMGFTRIDIGGFHARGRASYEPDQVGAEPARFADHLRGLLEKYGLTANDFFPQFGTSPNSRTVNDPHPAAIQQNLASWRGIVQFCKAVGFRSITTLPGIDYPQHSREANLAKSAETLRRYVEMAGEHGIITCYEPHMGSLTPTPELAADLCNRVPGLKVTLDPSHFTLQYIPLERMDVLIPLTGHVHVRQARAGKLQTLHSEGTIDFVKLVGQLRAVGYENGLSLEYVCSDWYDVNRVDTLNETMLTLASLAPHVPQ